MTSNVAASVTGTTPGPAGTPRHGAPKVSASAPRSPGRRCDVAIIGAGPYGLSAAAHLRAAGFEALVFGRAMDFWDERMPRGMRLRSSWEASRIGAPGRALTLEAFEATRGGALARPIPVEAFVDYGRWFQRQAVPDLDERRVHEVRPAAPGYHVRLEDGEPIEAGRVVVAAGIAPFSYRPAEFAGLPRSLVSHTVDHRELGRFAGRRMLVIGSGQSALESAALLAEIGADVEVLARASRLRWLTRSARLHRLGGPLQRLLYPPTDVGPPGLNWLVALPDVFRRLPTPLQDRVAYRSIRPAGSAWVRPRMRGARVTTGLRVLGAEVDRGEILVMLADGTHRRAHHVLLATGFRVDVGGYEFLAPELRGLLRCDGGYPVLSPGFESSMAGLHVLGAPAARSFGPLMRFVSGTWYAGRALTHSLLRSGAPLRDG